MRILELTRSDDYSAEELGDTIRTDSALTGRILKLANSAANTGVEPATTVTDSIMRLGTRTVRDLSMAFTLVSANGRGSCSSFDYDHYWARSLARAVCAQEISRALSLGKPEETYICALLAEVGMLALASVYEERYALLLASTGGCRASLLGREQEEFEIDHLQVASGLMSEWGLPELFGEAISSLGGVESGEEEQPGPLVQILPLAEQLAAIFQPGPAERAYSAQVMGDSVRNLQRELGMSEDGLSEFFDHCVCEWVAWGELLEVKTDAELCYADFMLRIASANNQDAKRSRSRQAKLDRASTDEDPAPASRSDSTTAASTGAPVLEPPARPAAPQEQEPPIAQRQAGLSKVNEASAFSDEEEEQKPIRVLAIDDDPVTLKMLVTSLERSGYTVLQATDGRQGLRAALSLDPDIVMSDWLMPEMDGLELCRELRRTESGRKMYFLLLTGQTEEEHIVEAFTAGVDDYVAKPFVPRILAARIKSGIRLVNLQRQIEKDKRIMLQQFAELGKMARRLSSAAFTDTLTELSNRRYAMKALETEWATISRNGQPLSLILFDIDRFKAVNDTFGHDVGDVVLRDVAQTVKQQVRGSDEVCRIGGEEFLIICRNTDVETAEVVAERIRKRVESRIIEVGGFNKSVTLSLGVAGVVGAPGTIDELIKRADESVYEAKRGGRNCVRSSGQMGNAA